MSKRRAPQETEIVLLGGGGHSKVVADVVLSQGMRIKAVVAPEVDQKCAVFLGLEVYSDSAFMDQFKNRPVLLLNGVGSLPGGIARRSLFEQYTVAGFAFHKLVSVGATVSRYAVLSEGVQILHGCVIQVDCRVGKNTIINTGAIVEHDCWIGDHCHLAPSATLCGSVTVGDRTHIGAGATVIQGITIGDDVVVGAGATVTKNLPDGAVFLGAKGAEKPR